MRARNDLIDSPDNLAAGAALFELRQLLGTKRGRNRVKPLAQKKFALLLAEHLGGTVIPQSTLSDWEGGEGVVPYTVLVAASRVKGKHLGRAVTVDEFLGGSRLSYVHGIAA